MARGINKVILIGNLGSDTESRTLPTGGGVTGFSVATSESWKDRGTGQPVERTEWHNVKAFNRLGEICQQYLKKGAKVYIEGSLRTNKWDKDGVTHYRTEIIASEMQMLDSRDIDAARGQAAPPQGGNAPQAPQAPPPLQGQQQSAGAGSFESFDDDIPF